MIDQIPAEASRDSFAHFFTNRLIIAYMQEQFGLQFESRAGRSVVPVMSMDGLSLATRNGDVLRESKAYVTQDTLHLLRPRAGDFVTYQGLDASGDSYPIPGVYEKEAWDQVGMAIIQRDGKPFHWPAVEVRAVLDREEWRAITGYEGVYEISNFGHVRRIGKARGAIPGTILKQWTGTDGYYMVMLRNDGDDQRFPVHTLVAAAFLGPRPEGYHINHISGIRTENFATNLEYVTPLENYIHAAAIGNWHFKITPDDVRTIRQRFACGEKIAHIARDFKISRCYCSKIVHRLHWSEIY